ncbi:MAG: fibronectin type III domain-containing protein [Treponema sp.]|nr:fibronectin type III domain-containing protein [Treponema sp.]
MKKSILSICFIIVSLFLILLTGCEVQESFSKKTPELTKPEITLKLSEDDPKTKVIVSWTKVKDADNYSVKRLNERDGVRDIQYVGYVNKGEPLSITDESCENDTEYSYVVEVQAYDNETYYSMNLLVEGSKKYTDPFTGEQFYSSNYYEYSEIKSIKTQKDSEITLAYPKNVKVMPAENMKNALTLSWDPVEGATKYEVYFLKSTMKYHNEDFKLEAVTTETSSTIENLYNDHSYYFRIRAVNDESESLYSAKIEGKVPKADNTSMDKAWEIDCNEMQYIYSDDDTLWFKCAPEKGKIEYVTESYEYSSLSIFSEDGTILASGLPLNKVYGAKDYSEVKTVEIKIEGSTKTYNGIIRSIKNDIEGFTEGTTYLFRITKPENEDYLNFRIY